MPSAKPFRPTLDFPREAGHHRFRTGKRTPIPLANVGYARVSTIDQDPGLQLDALVAAGCVKIFEDRASGVRTDRAGLRAALDYARDGDVLVTWKLDRLGRSLPHLIETVAALEQRGVGFRSLTEAIDTTTSSGKLVFHLFGALGHDAERAVMRSVRSPESSSDLGYYDITPHNCALCIISVGLSRSAAVV
jgi:hypothetical protein